jgi:hypothetical protein
VELATNHPRMVFDLDDLDQRAIGRDAGDAKPRVF